MPTFSVLYNDFRRAFAVRTPRLYQYCERRKSLIKYLISGTLAGGTDLLLLFVFHGLVRMEIVLSTSLAFILSFLVSFSLQKLWTFRNHSGRTVHQLSLYLLNALLGLYLNGYFMHILVNGYAIWYLLAQIIVNLVISVWNFVVYKFVIFRHRSESAA